ncbi:DMT family transporter [Rhodobacter sp. Har01]|uniref:DMT family transporter n=1 Tax=Rhodobacter sp. Har01 TaxID=2883999 RepID=UPI001D05E18A|nr:DMT family transporter [Rhodobacter sp. Har01]MCB6179369.1 DMT family transporter [Rhodobacter sp. Har01]
MARSPALTGILLALGGTLVFSVNDVTMKYLSDGYALHQLTLIRSLVGMAVVLAVIGYSGTGLAQLLTLRPREHLARVLIVLVSNLTYFVGLSALPLADAAAVAYISPLAVTALSVPFLGERVGPRRWAAVIVGLVGVIVMLRPGAGVIQPAALLVLTSALLYASGNLMTRRMGGTESAMTLAFYVHLGFILLSLGIGLWLGDGHLASDRPLLGFLVRPWIWPPAEDWPLLIATGLSVAIGGLMMTQAYRITEVGLLAPFEYVGMPLAIFWGLVVFGTWPDSTAWWGIALICGAGLYVVWREAVRQRETT